MKIETILKRNIISLIFLTSLLLFSNFASLTYAIIQDNTAIQERDEKTALQYVPGEVLVKFKEGIDPQSVLQEINLGVKVSAESITRVYSIKPAVAKFKKEYKLEKDKDGWYWFRGKNYTTSEEISDTEYFAAIYETLTDEEKALYRTYLIKLPENIPIHEAIAKLEQNPHVEYAEPNYIYETLMLPDDPYYHSQETWGQTYDDGEPYDDLWGLKKINCEAAWDISQGEGVIVAVVDTGIDYNHPDLIDNMWVNKVELNGAEGVDDDGNGYIDDVYGYDFLNDDGDPMDGFGHGTHVAGTIAARGNNSHGVIGVAPKAQLMAVKGLSDESGLGTTYSLAKCLRYAVDNGAHVLNNSWMARPPSAHGLYPVYMNVIIDVFNYAHRMGSVAVAAAGNTHEADIRHSVPANLDTVIAVSAFTQNDERCFFSTYGELVDVAAPGGGYDNELGTGNKDHYNILSTMPNVSTIASKYPHLKISDGFWRLAGTSMACPHVSGLAALVMSRNPEYSPDQIRTIIQYTADDVGEAGKDNQSGYGRINALRALSVGRISVSIDSPVNHSLIRGNLIITGSAYIEDEFASYDLYYAAVNNPDNKTYIKSSYTTPVLGDILGIWDTTSCVEGEGYILTLVVKSITDRKIERSVNVIIDNVNQPPVFTDTRIVAKIGETLEYKIKAQDPDVPDPSWTATHIEYDVVNLPPGAYFDTESDTLFWEPTTEYAGTYTVTFIAIDGEHTVAKNIEIITFYWKTRQLTHNGRSYDPKVFDKTIIWKEETDETARLIAYDIETAQITHSIEIPGLEKIYIYGRDVVYSRHNSTNGTRDIYLYNLDSSEEILIGSLRWREFSAPVIDIYDDYVVWNRRPSPPSSIYLYSIISDNTEIIIDNVPYFTAHPSIYKNRIAWVEKPGDDCYLVLYDINTRQMTNINYDFYFPFNLILYDNVIVYSDYRGGRQNAYLYDIETNQERQIAATDEHNIISAIDKDKVIYARDYAGWNHYDFFLYDTLTDDAILLVQGETADIYQNLVVWNDALPFMQEAQSDIFLSIFFYTPMITSISPATVNTGSAIVIEGINLGYPHEDSYVMFVNGVKAIIENWDNTKIVCTVPNNALSGPLYVHTPGGDSNSIYITIFPPLRLNPIANQTIDEGQELAFNLTASGTTPNSAIHVYIAGDLNHDGWVTFPDRQLLLAALNSKEGDANYNTEADLDNDGWVVNKDWLIFAGLLGKQIPSGIALDSTSGHFSWTPTYEQAGEYLLTFVVTDGELKDAETVKITVNNVNRPPALNTIDNKTINAEARLEFTVSASDPDGDVLTYSASPLPQGASFDTATGEFSWTPTNGQAGTYNLTFTVTDGALSDSETIAVTVRAIVDHTPPELTITYPDWWVTVPKSGFYLQGTAEDPSGVEVRVYLYAAGYWRYTIWNQLASYNANTKRWEFEVKDYHIKPGRWAFISVVAKDGHNNRRWEFRFVNIGN